MRKLVFLSLLTLMLVSCGNNPTSSQPPPPAPGGFRPGWTQASVNDLIQGCNSDTSQRHPELDPSAIASLCQCIVTKLATNFNLSDVNNPSPQLQSQMQQVTDTCAQ